jgi:hypothetical protein
MANWRQTYTPPSGVNAGQELVNGDGVKGDDITSNFNNAFAAHNDAEASKTAAQTATSAAQSAAAMATSAAQSAAAAAAHSPYVDDETGTWFEWDNAAENYVDTGIKAKGQDGAQGIPGTGAATGKRDIFIQAEEWTVAANGFTKTIPLATHAMGQSALMLDLSLYDGYNITKLQNVLYNVAQLANGDIQIFIAQALRCVLQIAGGVAVGVDYVARHGLANLIFINSLEPDEDEKVPNQLWLQEVYN